MENVSSRDFSNLIMFQQRVKERDVGMMVMAPGESFLNNKVEYSSVVSPNKITKIF